MAAGSANVNLVHIDTFGTVNAPSDAGSTQPGFTVWSAHSPGTSSYDTHAGGIEYLLSSNAADEATNPVAGTGDYGAAAVDGNHVWIASEYIAHSCDYPTWGGRFFTGGSGDNLLGTCAGASHGPGPRTALGNWSTRVSEFTP
ncbi:MAG TPA: hypothetical protein VFU36_14400 [Jatrophihabitans sp.]|nr:hypothetical protein [Jatrophihabitans sp.]